MTVLDTSAAYIRKLKAERDRYRAALEWVKQWGDDHRYGPDDWVIEASEAEPFYQAVLTALDQQVKP